MRRISNVSHLPLTYGHLVGRGSYALQSSNGEQLSALVVLLKSLINDGWLGLERLQTNLQEVMSNKSAKKWCVGDPLQCPIKSRPFTFNPLANMQMQSSCIYFTATEDQNIAPSIACKCTVAPGKRQMCNNWIFIQKRSENESNGKEERNQKRALKERNENTIMLDFMCLTPLLDIDAVSNFPIIHNEWTCSLKRMAHNNRIVQQLKRIYAKWTM